MQNFGLPILFALFLWWFGTGIILFLDGRPRRTYKGSMLAASALLGGALWGLHLSSTDATPAGAYVAFTCAMMVWGWLEMSFLLQFLTGPRREACPPGSTGWLRTRYAIEAVLHHEIAILVGLALVAFATWGGANQLGLWTMAILWGMRVSAKLNVFLGVRNLYEQFLPQRLRYLESYFRRRPMNALFPVSVTVGTVVAVLAWAAALHPGASAFDTVAATFAGTLLVLGLLEHWFLVLPLPVERLWDWGMASRQPAKADPEAALAGGRE